MDRSITDRVFDEIPIFIIRLVAESGGSMTGGLAQLGNVGTTVTMRSFTICRASSKSVPGSKYILIDDKSGTDLERMTSIPGTPARTCSKGTVTRDSTSSAERPRLMV